MRPIADLEEELNEVAGHLNAQHARLAVLARELLDQPSAWASDGIWTLERYLCWRTGVSSGHARQLADIARRADELPECMAAFERGELSLDQATVLARKVPSWADAVAHHHRLHHQRRLGIAGNADVPGGIVFTDGNGKQILASGARPRPPGAPPSPPVGRYRHPLGERLDLTMVHFSPPNQSRRTSATSMPQRAANASTTSS